MRRRRPKRRRYVHVLFGLVVVAVLVLIFFDNGPEQTDPESPTTTTAAPQAAPTTTESPTTTVPLATTTTAAAQAVETTVTPVTTAPPAPPRVLDQSAIAYTDRLAGFKVTVSQLVAEINDANRAWDSHVESGATYRATESTLVDIVEKAGALEESARNTTVPSVLQDLHEGPDGPVELAARLVSQAEGVLAGLRLPAPDDGSQRIAALADFNAAAAGLDTALDDLAEHVRENAESLGLAASSVDLSEGAAAYLDSLGGLMETVAQLVTEINDANQVWDTRNETGATYREVSEALLDVLEGTRALETALKDLAAPDQLRSLHEGAEGPLGKVPDLTISAEAVLAGLRIPAPDDGSQRMTALADYNTAAEAFKTAIDDLIGYIEENAETLGILSNP